MDDFLKFRKMITPSIIQILFYILAGLSIIIGLIMMILAFFQDYDGGLTFLSGLLVLILGPIAIRIYCEVLILFFRMNETLLDIKKGLAKK